MKESFELNAVKTELTDMLTYDRRSAAIDMLYDIMVYANKHYSISVFEIFNLNHKTIDYSWDQYGWFAKDIINNGSLIISKTEDGKYRVFPNFSLMKILDPWQPVCCGSKCSAQYYDEMNSYPSWLNPKDIFNKPVVKKEILNEKPKEPKKRHEYSLSCGSSYRMGYKEDGTLCKNDYPSYSIHVNTTNPDIYYGILGIADEMIEKAQLDEEEED